MKKVQWIATGALLGALSCFSSTPPPVDVMKAPDATVLDIVVQRGSQFERYHVVREVLWQECGSVEDESFAPIETHISMLKDAERNALLKKLSNFLRHVANDPEDLPPVQEGDADVVQIIVRQNSAENSLKTPESAVREAASGSTRLLAELLSTFTSKKSLNCGGAG